MSSMYIGLAGNPNCGKTTLFNELTGSNGYVGNWPGVTVEKKQAAWRSNKEVVFVDLPGIYSLSPYTPEEVVSRDYLLKETPSAIINLVDSTNLERNLYLTTQLLEVGCPAVLGLNMSDILAQKGDVIDKAKLSEYLGVPVVEVSALKNENLDTLVEEARTVASEASYTPSLACFSDEVEAVLTACAEVLADLVEPRFVRWYSIKLFERDEKVLAQLNLDADQWKTLDEKITALETARDDDAESIITCERYAWIDQAVTACVKKAPAKLSTSAKIDKIVTNRFLGLPIFALIMFLVYYLAISTVGKYGTDWVNDNLFSDGFFISAQGQSDYEKAKEAFEGEYYGDQIAGFIAAAKEHGVETEGVSEAVETLKEDSENAEAQETLTAFYAAVEEHAEVHEHEEGEAHEHEHEAHAIVAETIAVHDENGNFLTTEDEPIVHLTKEGEPILEDGQELKVVENVGLDEFKTAVEALGNEPSPADFEGFVPSLPEMASNALDNVGASELVKSLVVDGVIGGVGSVLGFIPQMVVLFILLSFLEDCGYMSRVAFVMDRIFRRFGLSGKSFIPMLISTGCGIPGVMATKTIENENDRRMTAMLTTMMPCGAKAPIIALLMGVLMGGSDAWWVAPLFYFLGIVAIIVSGIMLKKTKLFAGDVAPFVMELPNYHFPALKSWVLHVWERIASFVQKAATIIFLASIGIWFLGNFGWANWEGGSGVFGYLPSLEAPENVMDFSLLASVGWVLGYIFQPIGAGSWQAGAASLSALIAKENLVSTFGVLYGLGEVNEGAVSLWQGFAAMFTDGNGVLHVGALCAFVAFNMLDAPCFAAIGTIRRQLNHRGWFWFAIAYQCIFAWVVALMIHQFYELIVFGTFGVWTVVALVLLAAMLFQLFRPMPHFDKE